MSDVSLASGQTSLSEKKRAKWGEAEGSANEGADTGACRFDLTTGLLAAAEGALPEAEISW